MFSLREAEEEAKEIIGQCDEEKFLRWCSDVVLMISTKLDTEAFKGNLDICTGGCSCSVGGSCNKGNRCGRKCVTMPREVEVVLSVLVGGRPTLGFGQNFQFHLNGAGTCNQSCEWQWIDGGANHFTYRDLITPAKLIAFLQTPEDNGKKLIVYGYDSNGNVLRRQEGGIWKDGYAVPTLYGVAVPDDTAPLIARITGITKDITVGSIRLATIDSSGLTGVNLAVYEPSETIPQYRRIILNRSCDWIRVAYLKSSKKFTSLDDHVPLHSRLGFLLGMSARKNYAALQIDAAHAFEADAARQELEAQMKFEAPLMFPLQVDNRSGIRDKSDYDIR